jgi:hypothetical protein
VSITVTAPGDHYQEAPAVTISGGSGSGASAIATIGPGRIHSVSVTAAGSGYTTIAATVDPPPFWAKWLKGGSKVVSTLNNSITLDVPSRASNFPRDTWAYLSTGPAFNELGGRYLRVRSSSTDSGVVTFDQNLTVDDFIADQTCLIPGPFIENLAIRNLNIGGLVPLEAGVGAIFVEGGVNVTIENVQMVNGDDGLVPDLIHFVGSQDIRLGNCRSEIGLSTSNTASIVDCFVNDYVTHSFVRDVVFSRCRMQGSIVPATSSLRFRFEDCEFDQTGTDSLTATDSEDLAFINCRVMSTGYGWTMEGPRVRIQDLQIFSGIIELRAGCSDAVIENVGLHGSASLTIQAGSSGQYANISSQPVIEGWTTYPAVSVFLRTMGMHPNYWIELGNIAGVQSNIWCRLAMSTDAYGTVAKLYLITMCDNDTFPLNTWLAV